MLTNETFLRHIAGKAQLKRAWEQEPIRFFGCTIGRWSVKEQRIITTYAKQADIIRTWMGRIPKITVITGARRTGKTSTAAYLGACWMTGFCSNKWPGVRAMNIPDSRKFVAKHSNERLGLIGGRSYEHIESVLLREYKELIPQAFVTKWYSKTSHSIQCKDYNGFAGRCNVRSYDQTIEQWKSGAYQFIHLDEEPPMEHFNECLERTRSTRGRIIVSVAIDDADVSWLPDACMNPMKFFGTDDFLHFKMGVEDVPDEIYPLEEKKAVYAKYDGTPMEMAVRKGEFAYLQGRWLPEFDPAIHIIEPFKIPDFWLKWRFMDAGVAAPSACLWAALSPNGIVFLYREYYKTGTTIDQRCSDIIEMSGNVRQKDGEFYLEQEKGERFVSTQLDWHEFRKDPTLGGGVDFHYVKAGLQVQPSSALGQEARREVSRKWLDPLPDVNHFVTHKKPGARVYMFNTCTNLIWEIQKKSVKRTLNERSGVMEGKIANKDDHLEDCLAYCLIELDHWVKEASTVSKYPDEDS